MKRLMLVIVACSVLSACANFQLPQLPKLPDYQVPGTGGRGSSAAKGARGATGPIYIGDIGGKGGYVVKAVTAYPRGYVCNVEAYKVGFRNTFIDQWGTEVLNDQLPRKYMINEELQSELPYVDASKEDRCDGYSVSSGEADGRVAAVETYAEFKKRLGRR
ncbi:hypothetical protein [Geobacter grbiciae]|uniref:hypothetical protein n=1 Tax=Geobacter grbiciae TaxID=155042 RepID=UPI001C012FF7|nr:hypothetical protein [Geobacter grbiciae]MBT1077214.1 hypothetical protein [Geobacter grbiciae]